MRPQIRSRLIYLVSNLTGISATFTFLLACINFFLFCSEGLTDGNMKANGKTVDNTASVLTLVKMDKRRMASGCTQSDSIG